MTRAWAAHLVVAILLMVGFRLLSWQGVSGAPYGYDEADYMYAASQGWLANWMDIPALSLPQFLRLGLDAGRDPRRRSELSETIRGAGDILFYRHWHGPLYYYALAALVQTSRQEQMTRAALMWIPALGVGLVYLGCLWVLPQAPAAALLTALLHGAGYTVAAVSEMAPHQLFVILSLASLFFCAKFDITGNLRWWWLAVSVAALAFVTMELALVGLAVLALYGWRWRRKSATSATSAAFWLCSAAVFVGMVLALWPAAILKLEPIRSYMFMGYLALFRKGAWGSVTFSGTWAERFRTAPLEWALLAVAIVIWWRAPARPAHRAAQPFLLFGGIMLAALLKVYATAPRYALPFQAPLMVFTGLILGTSMERWPAFGKWPAAVLAGLAVAGGSWHYLQQHPRDPDLRSRQVLELVRTSSLDGRRLLAPQDDVPLLHYYFPGIALKSYRDQEEKQQALAGGGIDAVVSDTNPVRLEHP